MYLSQLSAFFLYICALITIGLMSAKKSRTSKGYILGNRNLNYWVTAISANASDMSVWLFMGLPMAVYNDGIIHIWTAFGLIFFMFLNWHFVAPRLRLATERYQSLTIFTFFAKRMGHDAKSLRILGAIFTSLFLTIYVSAGITGMGYLFESIFAINYVIGCTISILAILIYISVGGFTAICYTDFAQGLFLLMVIILVPSLVFFAPIEHSRNMDGLLHALSEPIMPKDLNSAFTAFTLAVGWGVGYFGQPHILNKFMAIKNPSDLNKSKWIGTCWQILALFASVASGIAASYFFATSPSNTELIFVDMVKAIFNPFFGSLILCAIFAATLSTVDSQVLVIASVVAEDFYLAMKKDRASDKKTLLVSRITAMVVCLVALMIALFKISSIFSLVQYCWVGIGAAFGPLVIASLYFRRLTKHAALASVVVGGMVGALWTYSGWQISAALPGFLSGIFTIWLVSKFTED